MAGRPLFAFISLVLIAGALLLMFLIMLAGSVDHNPVSKFYFLEADTSTIPNALPLSRWTFWNICGVDTSGQNTCGNVHPAFPFDPPSDRNFGTTVNVPAEFIGTNKFFYLTRVMFAMALISLFFGVCAFFTGVLAMCTRLGAYLSGMMTMIAMFFQALTAALMTAAFVIGRNAFISNNETASLGKYAFGFEWAAFACFFISTVLFCAAGGTKKEAKPSYNTGMSFGRSKSTRSRASFMDGASNKEFV